MAHRSFFRRQLLPLWLATAAVPSIVVSARAEPTAADKETARSLLDEGDRKFAAKDYAGALEAYKAAHAIMNVPTTGIEVAKAEEQVGQLVEAHDMLLAVMRLPTGPNEPAAFTRARSSATERASALAARIPSIRVSITGPTDLSAVSVRIDGEIVRNEALKLPRKLNPGSHVINVTAAGFREASSTVTVGEGQNIEHTVRLEPVAKGATPIAPATASAPAQRDVGVATSRGSVSPLVYVGFGVGAVGIVVGGITGFMSLSQTSDLKERCPDNTCPPDAKDDRDRAETLATVSDVSFAVGIIGIGTGVVALLTGSGPTSIETKSASAHVRPWVSARSLGLTGKF